MIGVVQQALKGLNIQSQASAPVPSPVPSSGSSISFPTSTNPYGVLSSSAAGINSTAKSTTQASGANSSASPSSLSYSAVAAGSSSKPATAAAVLSGSLGLYGNPERVSASLPTLKPLPKYTDYDTFEAWKKDAEFKMLNTGGMFEVVTKSCDVSLQLAIDTESCGRSDETITQLWKLLHQKACAVLREAFTATLGDTLIIEAEQEQLLRPHLFIKGNANYLWSLLLNQFKPDPIAKMLKAFKALESLRYVPAKSTPVEYNTHFLSAINEIRIANPNQTFDESTRLALYLKGWPTELHQKLELVKSDSNPTLELAQRHLQRWYDDNGKKSRTKPDSPSPATQPPPSTSSPAPSTLAALQDANIAAKKKYLEAKQAFKSASSNQTQGGKFWG